ncbi:hypothetical protein LPJ53_005662, partial [Coemansia erecta]
MSCRARTRRLTRGRTQSTATPEVILVSSPEPPPVNDAAGVDVDADADIDVDVDMDFAFDSELQALIDECAQPQPQQSQQQQQQQQPALSRLSSQAERTQRRVAKTIDTLPDSSSQRQRPLTERRRFRLAGTSQSSQLSQLSQLSQPTQNNSNNDDDDVWWRRYEPRSVDDLAVHAKKVQQVRSWL